MGPYKHVDLTNPHLHNNRAWFQHDRNIYHKKWSNLRCLLSARMALITFYMMIISWKCFPHYWPFIGESLIDSGFPSQRASNTELYIFIELNKLLNNQSSCQWFEKLCWSYNVTNVTNDVMPYCSISDQSPPKLEMLKEISRKYAQNGSW